MIRPITKEHLPHATALIREAFGTVAREFGITPENSPRFTAFATTEERLTWHLEEEKRPMFGYFEEDTLVGYYSLALLEENRVELNNLAVAPSHRHQGIGKALLLHAINMARSYNRLVMEIGIVEENQRLRAWYESLGFVHTGTKKFDFFSFTCGYMVRRLDGVCYCGHDCDRCVTRLAPGNPALIQQAKAFYKNSFDMDIPPEAIHCGGGHSEDLFALCADCPFRSCARKKGLYFCAACPDYPCAPLAEYQAKYVNQCNQI